MVVLIFTGRYQTRPVGLSRRVEGPLSALGRGPGRAALLRVGSPGLGGALHPDHGPSWAPCPWRPLRSPQSGRDGSLGLGGSEGGGEAGEAKQLLEAC